MPEIRTPLAVSGLLLAAFALGACAAPSPEEQVAELRGRYTVDVNERGFVATPRYPEPPVVYDETEEGMEPGTSEEANGTGEEEALDDEMIPDEAAVEPEPEGYDVLLDLVVGTSSRETLPQLTVDIVQLNPDRSEKHRWPVTLDTSNVVRGSGVQITHQLENIDYEEGDVFYAEVRQDVPPAERASYPEFQDVP